MTDRPLVRIDLASLDSMGQPVLAYAYPRGETGIYRTTKLFLSFSGLLDLDECCVFITVGALPEELVFELGGAPEFKPGWAGAGSAKSLWTSVGFGFNNNIDITVQPQSNFPEQTKIVVRYYCSFGDGKNVQNSYEFTTRDESNPVPLRTIVEDMRRIALEFDEDIAAGTASIASSDGFVPVTKSIATVGHWLVVTLTEELSFDSIYAVNYEVANAGGFSRTDTATIAMDDYPVKMQGRGRMPQHWMEQDREQDGLLDKLCNLANEVYGLAHKDIVYSLNLWDVDGAYSNHVRRILESLGYDFLTTFVTDRKALSVLFDIYRRKGMRAHLPGIIYTLIGIQPVIHEAWEGVFILDESELDGDDVLGDGSDESEVTFTVEFARILTAQERRTVQRILDFAKPSNALYLIVEPAVSGAALFTLDESELDGADVLG